MQFTVHAACDCRIGRVRRNNEDNFYFNGRCLEAENEGLRSPVSFDGPLTGELCLAVFDGMGGERFGEVASFAAARELQSYERSLVDFFIPGRTFLTRLTARLNEAVVKAGQELQASRMGSTLAALYFMGGFCYVCNLGDSRAYRLRAGEFMQISEDHVDARPMKAGKKPGLIQYLGIDPEEMLIEPYIAKGKIRSGDQYLLCSDGLTDMLTNFEIADIMMNTTDAESCVQQLVQAALDHGGRDNVTAIVCRIS